LFCHNKASLQTPFIPAQSQISSLGVGVGAAAMNLAITLYLLFIPSKTALDPLF
jgi:hypothetical protein